MRDQIRKLVVGGPQSKEDQARIIEVSDSDDEESANVQPSRRSQAGQLPKPPDVTAAICEALKRSFVFSGISEDLLKQVGFVALLLENVLWFVQAHCRISGHSNSSSRH